MAVLSMHNIRQLASEGKAYKDYPDPNNPKRRILAEPVTIQYSFGKTVVVGAGFSWDEASVPWLFQWAFPKSGEHAYAALPHDVAYYAKFCTRDEADFEYYKWSLMMGAGTFSSLCRYAALRLFGWHWWNRTPSRYAIANRLKIEIV